MVVTYDVSHISECYTAQELERVRGNVLIDNYPPADWRKIGEYVANGGAENEAKFQALLDAATTTHVWLVGLGFNLFAVMEKHHA